MRCFNLKWCGFILATFISMSSNIFGQGGTGGGGTIGPENLSLLINQELVEVISVDDAQYIDLLHKMHANLFGNSSKSDVDSNASSYSLIIDNNLPYVLSLDSDGNEVYFMSKSILERHFIPIESPNVWKFVGSGRTD